MLLHPKERAELPEQLKMDMRTFIDGIKQSEEVADDTDNAALWRRLQEIFPEK